ncbi:MAG TPA: methyltransferase [Caulobacteraceae bacterium]|jgi:predicted methyltransferase|nr:methyltransferase [Caulobacteraceae bacterium]
MRKFALACVSVLAVSAFAMGAVEAKNSMGKPPAYIFTALGDKNRPAADVALDAARKPADTIAFAQVRPGDKVAELLPGAGYFTHIIADVVGPSGHVYAMTTEKGVERLKPVLDAHKNVTAVAGAVDDPKLPDGLDVVWTTQNYHDMHNNGLDVAKVNTAAFRALKPGGVYFVLDHAAKPGSGVADTNTLHRIDPAVVKREVEAAGFKLEAEGQFLRNPADDHTLKVFDEKIRHHTDQFAFRFRKPKH